MKLDPQLRDQILGAVPSLRAFAISLSGNVDRADDLVQETMLRALANIHSFQPGTNMNAWLFTILRNLFRSEYRKRKREVEDADGSFAESLKSHPEQLGRVEVHRGRIGFHRSGRVRLSPGFLKLRTSRSTSTNRTRTGSRVRYRRSERPAAARACSPAPRDRTGVRGSA